MSSDLHQETTKIETERHYDDVESALQGGTGLSRQISVNLTSEQFERLYLQPGGTMSKGDLSKRLGNPTPLGVAAFLVALTSLSIDLMGWGGVTSSAAVAQAGGFYFFTGIPMILAGIGEWILGNTFPSTVFITYGGFWMSAGFLFSPEQGIAAAITANDYNKGFGIYIASIAAMNLIYLVTSLRTNMVFVALFFFLQVAEFILVAAYVNIGNGNVTHIIVQLQVAGAFAFACALSGWYLLIVLMLGSTGVPLSLPVGDLSNFMSTVKKSE